MPIYRVPTTRARTKDRPHNTVAWQRASAAWLQQYPFCVLCLVRGDVNKGADEMHIDTQRNLVVDHITPHRGDADLFWDTDNWQTLCRCPCHDVVKQRHEQQGKTADDWYAMLRDEMQRHNTRDDVARLLPDHMVTELIEAPPGKGGVSAPDMAVSPEPPSRRYLRGKS
jgi:5-methylcytosine-specific restriction endonuclease McrA